MICTIPYRMVDGHIIVTSEDGKICLIDTGAHCSVGDLESVLFAGGTYPLQPALIGKKAHELSGPIGVRIDVLIGVDILNRYDMLIDPLRRVLVFSDEELDCEGEVLSIEQVMGVPIVTADVDGRRIRMFYDTGAKISFLRDEIATVYPQTGTADDFFVTFGPFQTTLHRAPMTLGSRNLVLDFGVLPPGLQNTLLVFGIDGILGNATLDHFMVAYLPRRNRIILMRSR
jgi:hypothetical protein